MTISVVETFDLSRALKDIEDKLADHLKVSVERVKVSVAIS